MTIKQMTPQQIRDDLSALALDWPGGIPPEQADRVNALQRELKRQNEAPWNPTDARPKKQEKGGAASVEELEKELRALSDRIAKTPNDASAQERFANVRFELRMRSKVAPAEKGEAAAEVRSSPLPPRALELPTDEDFAATLKNAITETAPRRDLMTSGNFQQLYEQAPKYIHSYTAVASGDDEFPIVLKHEMKLGSRIMMSCSIRSITIAEARELVDTLQDAIKTSSQR